MPGLQAGQLGPFGRHDAKPPDDHQHNKHEDCDQKERLAGEALDHKLAALVDLATEVTPSWEVKLAVEPETVTEEIDTLANTGTDPKVVSQVEALASPGPWTETEICPSRA